MAFRHAGRSLRRSPVFTLAVMVVLAVGIAAAGTMFAIVHGVLLAPLPYGEPERLVSVRLFGAESGEIRQPPALQASYAARSKTLDGIAFSRTGSSNVWVEGSDVAADSVVATWITGAMVPMLRIPPLLGRTFTAEEELRGGPDAVILSEAEWRTRFDADPDVLGKTLMVNSVAREIVGVMPARFSYPTPETRVWLPAKRVDNGTVAEFAYTGVARLAPGVTPEQAQRELAALLPRLADDFPRLDSGAATASWLADVQAQPRVVPLRQEITGGIARTLWMLAAAAALVLLVAWANVANLLLIRADGRQPELAVRAALGASRWRAATHFLAEAMLLAGLAGAIALPVVHGAVRALVAFGPADVPRLAELHLGWPALAFVALLIAASIAVCAAVPAGHALRASLSPQWREGGRSASAGKPRMRLRAAITTAQIAIALVVMIGSGLLLRTAYGLYRVHPGFESTHVTTLRTQLPLARYDAAAAVAFYTRLADAVRALPGVQHAGLASKIPLGSGLASETSVRVAGKDASARSLQFNTVDAGYFEAMSIPLIAGERFRGADRQRATEVLLGLRAARELFGDARSALGQHLTDERTGVDFTVIGLVGDVRDGDLASPPAPMAYRAMAQSTGEALETPRNLALIVKSALPPESLVPTIRRLAQGLDPTVPIYATDTMQDIVRASTARLSLTLALMTAAALVTLLLGSIGLYGVMAYVVALRTREFGVRVALGADPQRIARLVASRGLVLTASGIALGLLLYAFTAPFLRAFLHGVSVTDPATLATTTLLLAATACLASWLPARRAARVDAAGALRAE